MKTIAQRITNNNKAGDEYKEYDSTTYYCEPDDAWLVVELPRTR